MGLDGGTIITRSDVLRGSSWALSQADGTRSTRGGCVGPSKTYQKPELKSMEKRHVEWTTCGLSAEPLQEPIVSDWLGNLFNKGAVLQLVLAKRNNFTQLEDAYWYANLLRAGNASRFEHLRGRSDIIDIRFVPGNDWQRGHGEASEVAAEAQGPATPVACPMTGLSCLRVPFSALAVCGHVFSSKAIAQMQGICAICERPYGEEDVVALLGNDDQVAKLRSKLKTRAKQKIKLKRKREEAPLGPVT